MKFKIFFLGIIFILFSCTKENEIDFPQTSEEIAIPITEVFHTTPFNKIIQLSNISISKPEHHFMIIYKLTAGNSQFSRLDIQQSDTTYEIKVMSNKVENDLIDVYDSPKLSINYIIYPLDQIEIQYYVVKFWQSDNKTIEFTISR